MKGNVRELSLPTCSVSSSSLNNPTFLLLGKSIVFQQQQQQQQQKQQRTLQKTTSHCKKLINDTNENPMRHIKRIRQLFLMMCAHGDKHGIGNHYQNEKSRQTSKARAKAKHSMATLYRQQQQQHQQQLLQQRKKATFAKLVSTAIVHRRRAVPPPPTHSSVQHRPIILSQQRDVLQIPSFTFPRVIPHESTINVRKGRQTLCNLRQPNDLCSIATKASGKNPLTNTISLNRFIQKGRRKNPIQLLTSLESIACNAKPKSFQTIDNNWLSVEHRAQPFCRCLCRRRRCGRKSQRQTCTTNQQKPHVEAGTVPTNTTAPNCYDWQQRKTYSSNTNASKSNKNNRTNDSRYDHNHNCINNNDTNKTEWYIHLASNCYQNGFQLHVNHLEEWSKHPCVAQKKPIQVPSILRLPSSALKPTATTAAAHAVPSKTSCVSHKSISTVHDIAGDTSIITQPPIRVDCERINLNYNNSNNSNDSVLNDCIAKNLRLPQPLNDTDDIKRIYVENFLKPNDTQHSSWSFDVNSKLPVIDTETIVKRQRQQQQNELQPIDQINQFDTLNAENTMNRVVIDANIHLQQTVNRQLSCQASQNYYQNNNLTFGQEFYVGAQQSEPQTIVLEGSVTATAAVTAAAVAVTTTTIANSAVAASANIHNNNNYNNQQLWLNECNSDAYVSTNSQPIKTRLTATNDIDVDDLIESFSTTFDVNDPTERGKLPQIVLSDFSNNQLISPPTTPLAFAIQSTQTLSEHPDQLQELQHQLPKHIFYETASALDE